jgi:SUN domain-containing protein 1/2
VRSPTKGQSIKLAQFTYDVHSPDHIQLFPVLPGVASTSIVLVDSVVVFIRSNWGDATATCLYRIRVHGSALSSDMYDPALEVVT